MRAPTRERSRRGGIYFRLLVALAAVFALAALAWMLLLPIWVTSQIQARTGFDANVASLSCNPFTGRLTIRGLVLTNPPGFSTDDFVQLREFRAEGDLLSLFSERITLDELVLDVRRLALVRRADGLSNAELFEQNLGLIAREAPSVRAAQAKAAATPSAPVPGASPMPKTAALARKFLIRRFALRFDQLLVADDSAVKPEAREYRLAVDQHYENVTDTKQLLVPDVLKRVSAENLGPVLGRLVPGDFGRALGDTARQAAMSGEALLKDAGTQATDLLRGLRERLDQTKKP